MDKTFDPQTLSDDLCEVQRIYARFLAGVDTTQWDKPVKGGPGEWTLHETLAHLCALNGAGLDAIKHALRGELYTFSGLDNRYVFNAYNRKGIDEHLGILLKALSSELLGILDDAAVIARNLRPEQVEQALHLPIYNRSVKFIEALSIIMIHTGLFHSAQVAEPAGLPPLWTQLSPEVRHRTIGRVMRAFSLLYRQDLGGDLSATLAYRVDGPGGGDWHIDLSPETTVSEESAAEHARLTIHLRDTAAFCQMFTRRLALPPALLTGQMKLRGSRIVAMSFCEPRS